MCKSVRKWGLIDATAYWRKDNWPLEQKMIFHGLAAPCACGKQMLFRADGFRAWIEVEPEEKSA